MSGYVTATVAVISAAVGTFSSIESANTQRQQAEYQADMANYNAQVAEGNAQIAEDEGRRLKQEADEQATKKRQEAALIIGKQRASQGASGVMVDAGSSLDLNIDTAEKGELEAFQLEKQGILRDYNKNIEAQQHRSQASILQSNAANITNQANQYSPLLNTTNTVLTGVKKVNDAFIDLK